VGDTTIEWSDKTWNPTRGCSRVSPGCGGAGGVGGCYAERVAGRFSGPGQPYEGLVRSGNQGARWTGDVILIKDKLEEPLHWRKPRRVFVNSMSDLFHEALDTRDIDQVFAVMALAPQHTFQVLTKRARRMHTYFNAPDVWPRIEVAARRIHRDRTGQQIAGKVLIGPLPNVWLGVSAEDQQRADERIPLLLQTPAVVRFVSYEPALGPVDFSDYLPICSEKSGTCGGEQQYHCGCQYPAQLHWVICGAESGPGARPMDEAWVRAVRDQCQAAGVAFFLKQMIDGESSRKISLPLLDGRRHMEFPR
jgi:protein gp37